MRSALLSVLLGLSILSGCGGGVPGPKPTPTPTPRPTPTATPTPCVAQSQMWLTQPIGTHIVHLMPTERIMQTVAASCTPQPLRYNGGLIQSAPKPYLIFWGDWSAKNDPDNVQSLLTQFYQAMLGSLWLNTVTQYSEADGKHVGNLPAPVAIWNDSVSVPATPTDSDLGNEAAKGAAHFGDTSVNAIYVVAIQHGSSPDGFGSNYCAWHSTQGVGTATIVFINLPYQPDAPGGCGANAVSSITDGVTIVAGHEQAEAETDPMPMTGWADSTGGEIGDKCAWQNLQDTAFSTQRFATQPLWSNAGMTCVQ